MNARVELIIIHLSAKRREDKRVLFISRLHTPPIFFSWRLHDYYTSRWYLDKSFQDPRARRNLVFLDKNNELQRYLHKTAHNGNFRVQQAIDSRDAKTWKTQGCRKTTRTLMEKEKYTFWKSSSRHTVTEIRLPVANIGKVQRYSYFTNSWSPSRETGKPVNYQYYSHVPSCLARLVSALVLSVKGCNVFWTINIRGWNVE